MTEIFLSFLLLGKTLDACLLRLPLLVGPAVVLLVVGVGFLHPLDVPLADDGVVNDAARVVLADDAASGLQRQHDIQRIHRAKDSCLNFTFWVARGASQGS